MRRYHSTLFRWHCRHFFDFRSVMDRSEVDYLRACWDLATSFEEISEGGYEQFSYYTYSHRVSGRVVNSSRIAYGSISRPREAFEAAREVLGFRGIDPDDSLGRSTIFYGLGWDFERHDFKLYFRTLDWRELHPSFLRLAAGYDPAGHRREALLSVTYRFRQVEERKLYLYPLPHLLPAGARGQARMITDRRGEVAQHDLDPGKVGEFDFNATGRAIIARYEEIGESLDTVAYQDRENFTLYFP